MNSIVGDKLGRRRNKETARINSLKLRAKDLYRSDISPNDIELEDITDLFMNEIPFMLRDEVVSIAIVGNTKGSKSTTMCYLVDYIQKNYYGRNANIGDIFADQFEFGRKVTDHNLKNTIVGIDEFGAMEETGANATIEAKHLEQFSDLQAQRNIHRVACSPRIVMDKNAFVIIKIEGKDTEKFLTHALIYYKVETPSEWFTQLIGRASFYVKDIMFDKKGWKLFLTDYKQYYPEYKKYKQKRNEKVTINGFWKYINDKFRLTEEDQHKYFTEFYANYRKRKFKKMELMNKEGIMHMRELLFVDIIYKVYKRLEKRAFFGAINKDVIESKIGSELKKIRYPLTIYAMEVIKSRVNNLICQKKDIERTRIELTKPKHKPQVKEILLQDMKLAEKELNEDINELLHLIEVGKKYNNIG